MNRDWANDPPFWSEACESWKHERVPGKFFLSDSLEGNRTLEGSVVFEVCMFMLGVSLRWS